MKYNKMLISDLFEFIINEIGKHDIAFIFATLGTETVNQLRLRYTTHIILASVLALGSQK